MTKAEWAELPGKGQWDIMVALRGPDSCYGETLKWYTTSVIRGHLVGVIRVGGLINTDLNLIIVPSSWSYFGATTGKAAWCGSHFLDHVRSAAEWLHIPELRIELDLWHKVMSQGSAVAAAKTILSAGAAWQGGRGFYSKTGLDELARHMEGGGIRF